MADDSPFVSLASGGHGIATIPRVHTILAILAFSMISATLLIAGLVDLTDFRIPRLLIVHVSVVGGTLLVSASGAVHHWDSARNALLGGVLIFAVFFALHLLPRGGLGFGDVRLAGMCGEFLGWLGLRQAFFGLALALILAGISAACLLASRVVRRSSQIPLGPFISLGALIAMSAFGGKKE